MPFRDRWGGVALAVVTLAVAGCDEGGRSSMVPVDGVVLLDGQPLQGGTVTFQPAVGQAAIGEIGNDGRFKLSTHARHDGVAPGTYRVSVTANEPLPAEESSPDALPSSLVPLRYTRVGTSGIEFTFFHGRPESVTVELQSEVDAAANEVSAEAREEPAESAP
jgi:hypothetical protein